MTGTSSKRLYSVNNSDYTAYKACRLQGGHWLACIHNDVQALQNLIDRILTFASTSSDKTPVLPPLWPLVLKIYRKFVSQSSIAHLRLKGRYSYRVSGRCGRVCKRGDSILAHHVWTESFANESSRCQLEKVLCLLLSLVSQTPEPLWPRAEWGSRRSRFLTRCQGCLKKCEVKEWYRIHWS